MDDELDDNQLNEDTEGQEPVDEPVLGQDDDSALVDPEEEADVADEDNPA